MITNNKAFCVHGHFYQPPREDPLTGEIPVEPGAAPYRNWNERINAQCYQPNAQLGNFEHISFNIGPTLLDWMARYDPETLQLIIAQEQRTCEKYGVGNGMAQAYHHTILPLASLPDKFTQVRWGIANFTHYFGHKPQGMWLPETAVDEETLSVLARCGIEFTILAPWQADTDNLDPSQPYRVELADGNSINVFFYNQDLSTRISFDPGATVNADRFIQESLLPKFQNQNGRAAEPQLVMTASDGELYGHHQPFRDKFLAYLVDHGVKQYPLNRTFPALWLRLHPVQQKIKIRQRTSWSCFHGVTRWMDACGCTPNGHWKFALRQALDQLGDAVNEQYLKIVSGYLPDPWELRHRYIHVILGEMTVQDFLSSQLTQPISSAEQHTIHLLLKAQFERQRIFTSCGWFFDDFDRIEPRNNVAYAAQAVWLTEKATGADLFPLAMSVLSEVRSPRSGLRADEVFLRHWQRASRFWKDDAAK